MKITENKKFPCLTLIMININNLSFYKSLQIQCKYNKYWKKLHTQTMVKSQKSQTLEKHVALLVPMYILGTVHLGGFIMHDWNLVGKAGWPKPYHIWVEYD